MSYLIMCLAFAGGVLLVFGTNLMLADVAIERRRQLKERLERELRRKQQERARQVLEFRQLQSVADDTFKLEHDSLKQRFLMLIEQSGLRVNPRQVASLCLAAAFLPALLTLGTTQQLLYALPVAVAGGLLPLLYVMYKRSERREKLLSQLPDAFELMSRMLRAGQTIPQALQGVADEFAHPLATEFGCCYEQQNLGMSMEASMADLAQRTGLLEIKIFVVAAAIHQQAGGNFSQLLDQLSHVIRARYRIRGQIRALTAEGKLQAAILLGLPFVMLFGMMIISRDYINVLFEHYYLLIGMVISEIIGALWIRKIVNFDF
ncbi:MAG: type II secretion system F family protein [Pirellulaceae bacterium]|nr:type II secretion system F family protein [Pirellulaceae bacterium]